MEARQFNNYNGLQISLGEKDFIELQRVSEWLPKPGGAGLPDGAGIADPRLDAALPCAYSTPWPGATPGRRQHRPRNISTM